MRRVLLFIGVANQYNISDVMDNGILSERTVRGSMATARATLSFQPNKQNNFSSMDLLKAVMFGAQHLLLVLHLLERQAVDIMVFLQIKITLPLRKRSQEYPIRIHLTLLNLSQHHKILTGLNVRLRSLKMQSRSLIVRLTQRIKLGEQDKMRSFKRLVLLAKRLPSKNKHIPDICNKHILLVCQNIIGGRLRTVL